jgi:hypothetical protein
MSYKACGISSNCIKVSSSRCRCCISRNNGSRSSNSSSNRVCYSYSVYQESKQKNNAIYAAVALTIVKRLILDIFFVTSTTVTVIVLVFVFDVGAD